ncbi:hypothetical protein [Nocardia seriolae]|uniref:Uncharacterized protein n=1 Tax=Nocardia seriolae TaxID=37332 RepID=A0ABC8AXY1_9NOCA|nr:hypothetical protein [Nocardia seriolae]APA99098.1 hypothetical protein NS506_05052 [Nocardia seriolae]OJF80845.1 hypothetical protein NS14008_18605 [Nocardia seriolae]PSK26906.1 hypothetical protein C6575_34745 [Nocardia seriolae]QOW35198.1 hypothetical protein IMZ23_09640 [Nocardia seriolae]QUN17337.1 hypothetical protein KEC46_35355 [Nocardia seriolae]
MSDILDLLHSRWAEAAAEAILAGDEHPALTLTTVEVADLIDHLTELRRAAGEAVDALDRIRVVLDQHTAHPEARARQAATIARFAAERLTAARAHMEMPES